MVTRTVLRPVNHFCIALIFFFCCIFSIRSSSQNIAINTTGTAAAAANLLEVTQTGGNNTVGIFSSHTGTGTNAYAIWAEATGATNKYALVVPSGGGYVGIGTTTPTEELHIITNAPSGNRNSALFENTASGVTAANAVLVRSGASDLNLAACHLNYTAVPNHTDKALVESKNNSGLVLNALGASSIMTFETGSTNSERMRIDVNGNVGIGNAAPTTILDISKSSTGNSLGSFPSLRVANTNATQGDGTTTWNYAATQLSSGNGVVVGDVFSAYNSTGMDQNGLYVRTQTNHPIVFAVNFSTEAMRITNAGNVGIGTSTPFGQLQINNASNQASFLMSDTRTAGNQVGRVVYDGGTIVTGGGWVFQKMTDAGAFSTNLVSIIQNTGNVGINTLIPLSKLDVAGGVAIGTYAGANAAPSNGLIVSGFFGVGTNNPLRPMHLYTSTANNDGRLRITATSTAAGQQSGMEFYGYGGNANNFGGGILRDQNTNDISIFTGSGGTTKFLTVLDGGNVGIGNTNPSQKLEVGGSIRALNSIWASGYAGSGGNINAYTMEVGGATANSSGSESAIFFHHHSVLANQLRYNNGTLYWEAAGNGYGTTASPILNVGGPSYLAVNSGNVGIGTASAPTYKLTVNGQPGANGYTAFTNYSDARLKKNIAEIENSLDKILKLHPVQFNYNEEYLNLYNDSSALTRLQKGFIAQEVKVLFPEMVGVSNIKGKEYYDLNLSNLQIYMVKAIQEQQKIIDDQKKEIEALNSKFSILESIVKTLLLQIDTSANK